VVGGAESSELIPRTARLRPRMAPFVGEESVSFTCSVFSTNVSSFRSTVNVLLSSPGAKSSRPRAAM